MFSNTHSILALVVSINYFAFLDLQRALHNVGLAESEIRHVFSIVAAILKLGNVHFVPTTNMDGTEGCTIANDYGKEPLSCIII